MADPVAPTTPAPAQAVGSGPFGTGGVAPAVALPTAKNPGARKPAEPAPTIDPVTFAAAFAVAQQSIQQTSRNATIGLDQTHPNGHYVVDGRHVNAWGEEVEDPEESDLPKDKAPRKLADIKHEDKAHADAGAK